MKGNTGKRNYAGVSTGSRASQDSVNSVKTDDVVNKDNEDPNVMTESRKDQFDPKELKQIFDGWSLYRKMRISFAPVRRY